MKHSYIPLVSLVFLSVLLVFTISGCGDEMNFSSRGSGGNASKGRTYTEPYPITDSHICGFQCSADLMFKEVMKTDSVAESINVLNSKISKRMASGPDSERADNSISVSTTAPRKIPVVFHVVHQCRILMISSFL